MPIHQYHDPYIRDVWVVSPLDIVKLVALGIVIGALNGIVWSTVYYRLFD